MKSSYAGFTILPALAVSTGIGLAQSDPPIPGGLDDGDPDTGPVGHVGIEMIDRNSVEEIREIFENWERPVGLTSEGQPLPSGFELWRTAGGPERALAFSRELTRWQDNEQREAEEFSARTGIPMVWNFGPPSSGEAHQARMVGVENGLPVYLRFLGVMAADAIETDELWSTSRQGRAGLSGLNLHGEGTQLAMWDRIRVQFTHQEFLTNRFSGVLDSEYRVFNSITTTGKFSSHATPIAGIMVAGGAIPRKGFNMEHPFAMGMSPGATLLAHSAGPGSPNIPQAYANTNNHFRVSNHSYSYMFTTGWTSDEPFNGKKYPMWWGDFGVSREEHYGFGFYFSTQKGDDNTAWWCPHHLAVWPAGNDRKAKRNRPPPPLTDNMYLVRTNISPGTTVYKLIDSAIVPPPVSQLERDGGYDTLVPSAVGKNGLAVGAVNTFTNDMSGLTIKTNIVMTAFSGWGPTDDGRIKPDLVAAGLHIFAPTIDGSREVVEMENGISVTNTVSLVNNNYTWVSGTSYAAPTVTGSLNLLIQLQRRQTGTRKQDMLSSTLKGLAIHTAVEAGDHPGPDYRFGWGLFNALAAATLMTNNHHSQSLAHIKETYLLSRDSPKDHIGFEIIARGGEPLKVTAAWTDPAPETLPERALDSQERMLVNDLDLRLVTDIDGTAVTNYPWVLDPASPRNAAVQADNDRDNVEQVLIENPGTNQHYAVQVTYKDTLTFPESPLSIFPDDKVENEVLQTNQWVSLFISGNVPQPEPPLTIEFMSIGTNTSWLRWPSVVGRVYQLNSRTNLLTGDWENEKDTGEVVASKTNTAVEIKNPSDDRFFRVVRVR